MEYFLLQVPLFSRNKIRYFVWMFVVWIYTPEIVSGTMNILTRNVDVERSLLVKFWTEQIFYSKGIFIMFSNSKNSISLRNLANIIIIGRMEVHPVILTLMQFPLFPSGAFPIVMYTNYQFQLHQTEPFRTITF